MKNIKLVLLAFFGLYLFVGGAAAQFNKRQDYVALYRLYNSQSRDHLYTTDCQEKDNLLRSGGYAYEGIAGYVATRQMRRTMPLYRLLLSSDEHFYTSDAQEMNNLVQTGGGKSEGIVGYIASSQERNTAPFYRLINDRHLYTTSEQEKNTFLQNGGRLEKTTGYLWNYGDNSCDYSSAPDPNSFPTIYAGTNFDGAAEAVERDKTDLRDWDGSPNTIRSIRVPQGWFLVLYEKKNFRGKSYNLNSNITLAPGDAWYNRIRSIKVYKGTPPIQPRY